MNKGQIKDGVNFLTKLTIRRTVNALRLLSSYYVSKSINSNFHSGNPISVSVEPTTSCNLQCPECPSGLRQFTRPTGMLKMDFFKETIDQLYKDLLSLTFYFQGEPYLNPKFLDMVKYASDKGIYTCTSTNAHYLTKEIAEKTIASGLDRLIISIDGTTQDVYQQYRVGGRLNKVLEGTKEIIKAKRKVNSNTPHVIFQFLVVRPNEHQVKEIKQLAQQIGVDVVKFKTAQIYDYENGNDLIPTIDEFSRYKLNGNGKYHLKNKLLNECWKMWHSCVITWDGKVVPCCFDKDAHHQLGDLRSESFSKLWKSDAYNQFRVSLLKSRKEIDICQNCTEGTKVWV
ncbi:MAG: radical SAM protein [Bacteroidetes bacterium]|nr:SPASM domain-containing protein [Bacteroidia bacterium]PCH68671.1 MAG: radical SAM protein [Bacteroidota bacterium]